MLGPVITFDDRNLRHGLPTRDEPMVISIVAAEYKIERVLVDQGSEQVLVKGVIEIETVFGESSGIRCISMLYIVVDIDASYNIILGRSTLNKLVMVVSTWHMCMKFLIG
ncbi:hypothetical protein CR513_45219, partial [Mucuna pruriens]